MDLFSSPNNTTFDDTLKSALVGINDFEIKNIQNYCEDMGNNISDKVDFLSKIGDANIFVDIGCADGCSSKTNGKAELFAR